MLSIFECYPSNLPKIEERTGPIQIRPPYQKSEWFVSQVAGRSGPSLGAMDQRHVKQHSNINTSQDEPQDPLRNTDSTRSSSDENQETGH